MNKEEYKTIINLLNENKIDELRKYLDNRMNSKYTSQVQKTILKLINSDCDRQYPSYYQRTQLHEVVKKYYRGFYTRKEIEESKQEIEKAIAYRESLLYIEKCKILKPRKTILEEITSSMNK